MKKYSFVIFFIITALIVSGCNFSFLTPPPDKIESAYSSTTPTPTIPPGPVVVTFPDYNLETIVRSAIDKPTGDILSTDLATLSQLFAYNKNITDITGLEYCTSLTTLQLGGNAISDVSA